MRRPTVVQVVTSALSAVLLAACGGGGDTTPTNPGPVTPVVSSVTVSPTSTTLKIGAEQTLTATPLANGTAVGGRTVTWSSAAPSIATVSSTGVVHGVAPGSTTVTATVDGQSGTAAVVVENPAPTLTGIAPASTIAGTASLTLTVNGTGFLSGTVLEWNGSARPTTVLSATQLTATITATDLAQVGTSVVRVRTPTPGGGASDSTLFNTTPIPVASVVLTTDTATLVPAQTRTLVASARDSLGRTLTGRVITFASSNTAVATVNATSGVVSAVARGAANITATSEGKSVSAAVTVRPGGFVGASGGQITVGNVTLDIPANAVSTGTAFTIDSLASPVATQGLMAFSAVLLGPSGVTFAVPVSVTMRWSAAQLPGGADPTAFAVHRFNGTAWGALNDRVIDVAARTVRGTTTGFSPFAIVQLPPPPPTSLSVDEVLFTRSNGLGLWAVNVNTRVVRQITSLSAESPAISPDRRTIAFRRNVNGRGQVVLVDFDGQNSRVLTDLQFDNGPPTFSADGSRVFFARDLNGLGNWKIVSASVATGAITPHSAVSSGFPNDFAPVVDPSNTRIAVSRAPTGSTVLIATTALDGQQATNLTPLGTGGPVYSPNGTRIAYVDFRTSGTDRIAVMNADGSNQTVVASINGTIGPPSWSPDGTQLVFAVLNASTGFSFQLFKVNIDGSGLTQLTFEADGAYLPRWSRN